MFGSPALHDKFFSRLVVDPSGCILWTGPFYEKGYGQCGGKRAHHVSWFIKHGYWPEYLMHSCDIRNCVKLAHLSEATNQDNVDDMVAKDRHSRGERNAFAKLTDEAVLDIRRICQEERLSYQEIGARFGISGKHVMGIHHRLYWRHLPGEFRPKLIAKGSRGQNAARYRVGAEWLTVREIAERAGVTEVAIGLRLRAGVAGEALLAAKYAGPRKTYTRK